MLTTDSRKKDLVGRFGSLDELNEAVQKAVEKYSAEHENSRLRKWINKFSQRVMYYGNIMDVVSQHHPEYVSLAWGAMKFVFVVCTTIHCADHQAA